MAERHYLFGEDRSLELSVHVGLILGTGMGNSLDVRSHFKVSRHSFDNRGYLLNSQMARASSHITKCLVFHVLLAERSLVHGWENSISDALKAFISRC